MKLNQCHKPEDCFPDDQNREIVLSVDPSLFQSVYNPWSWWQQGKYTKDEGESRGGRCPQGGGVWCRGPPDNLDTSLN